MTATETKQVHSGKAASKHPQGAKKRQLSPEQLEKMRLGRIAKAKERKEAREKEKMLTKQAIQQQKERIELLNITKKKKAEIKRRLAEVKKGTTPMEEVKEIIEQYDPDAKEDDADTGGEADQLAPQGRSTDTDNLKLEIEKFEEEQRQKELEDRERLRQKVKDIKEHEEAKIKKLEEESNKYEDEYKAVVNKIMNSLPKAAQKYFKLETDNFDPTLSVEENIQNMISNLNNMIENNIKTVENVKETLEDIEEKESPTPDVENVTQDNAFKSTLRIQKKMVKTKLSNLYKLR